MLTIEFLLTIIRRAVQLLEQGKDGEALQLLKEAVKDL
jgi:hypothetical protein